MSQATATLSVRLPVEMKNRLDRLAENTATSRSKLAADATTSFVDLYEWKVAEIPPWAPRSRRGGFASPKEVRAVFWKWAREDLWLRRALGETCSFVLGERYRAGRGRKLTLNSCELFAIAGYLRCSLADGSGVVQLGVSGSIRLCTRPEGER